MVEDRLRRVRRNFMLRDDGLVDGGIMIFCFVGRCGVWEYGTTGKLNLL